MAVLDVVLHTAMAKDPSHRFPSCRAFAAALADAGAGLSSPADPTQPAMNVPTPRRGQQPGAVVLTRRRAVVALAGVAVLLVVGLVAFVGARLGQPPSAPPATYSPSPARPASQPPESGQTDTGTAPPPTVSQPGQPPITVTPPIQQQPQRGDLGLGQPISHPSCNGQGIVILGSVTTPGLYAAGVQRLLDAHPGAFYLRTDQTCPSLRPATAEGNPIYAVFQLGGKRQAQVCAAVNKAGEGAYGKWLDTTTDPEYIIPC